jgi:5-methyltetrahydrofolate--homocysteine methyltransferase
MKPSVLQLAEQRTVLLDGGMGTELMKHGLSQGECPELWNVKKPETIKKIHTSYFESGSDVILTNSFGGNKIKLASSDLEKKCYELNFEAARIANQAKPKGKFVAGSMGPTGKFLQPHGDCTEKEFENAYAEQAKALSDGKVDFLLIETQYDLKEAICALRAAREQSFLPVFVTMTFKKHPKGFYTIMGNSIHQCVEELEINNVPAIGANCTVNSEEMADIMFSFREATSLPLMAQANAGDPVVGKNGGITYSQSLKDYIRFVPAIVKNGASLIGGCCGTSPEYIKRMAEVIFHDI